MNDKSNAETSCEAMPRDNGRFSEPSSFDEESGAPWPEGVPQPVPGDPLYQETMAAVRGYSLNGKRYEIGPDGKPQVVTS